MHSSSTGSMKKMKLASTAGLRLRRWRDHTF
jgi:hypothetical protein